MRYTNSPICNTCVYYQETIWRFYTYSFVFGFFRIPISIPNLFLLCRIPYTQMRVRVPCDTRGMLYEELIRLSAYVKGSDSKVDMAISKKDAIDEFLKQRIETKSTFEEAKKILTNIFLNSQEDEY